MFITEPIIANKCNFSDVSETVVGFWHHFIFPLIGERASEQEALVSGDSTGPHPRGLQRKVKLLREKKLWFHNGV